MRNDFYPVGNVVALLDSAFITPQTKAVLQERLQKKQRTARRFFDDDAFALVEAVCDCLLPQNERAEKIPLAMMLEEEIVTGKGKGWRFDVLPPTKEAMLNGLKGIEEEAKKAFNQSFQQLSIENRKAILTAIQNGNGAASVWQELSSNLFFTELLALLTEFYYSHPFAKEEIGDVSFTDAKGWKQIGLNDIENRELNR